MYTYICCIGLSINILSKPITILWWRVSCFPFKKPILGVLFWFRGFLGFFSFFFFFGLQLMTNMTIPHSLTATESWDSPNQFSRRRGRGPGAATFLQWSFRGCRHPSLTGDFVVTLSMTNTSLQRPYKTHYYSSRRSPWKAFVFG